MIRIASRHALRSLALALAVFGLAAAAPAAAGDGTITIGFTNSETGALNVDSSSQLNGFKLWADQVNAAGGISVGGKKQRVVFVTYDDQSKADRVQQLYSRLILQDNADFLFSPYSSGLTATAAIISEQYGKVMITTGAAENKTYQQGNKYLFQMYAPATTYLSGALEALKSVNPKAKLAVAYKDDSFSKAVAQAALARARTLGFEVVFNEAYAPTTTDFGPLINKIISAGADALVGGGHYADGATLARQVFDHKVPLTFLSLLVAPDSPQFASLGDSAINVTAPSQWAPQVTFKPDFGPTPAAFDEAYKTAYGKDPGYHAAGGYGAGLVLQHAIEQAGSLDADAVTAKLNSLDATIFFGHVKFAEDPAFHGLQTGHAMVSVQWQKKGAELTKEVVWPKGGATAPLAYPLR
ncbi:MAG: amino acid ABC transporter substrate-binding protein [Rhodospirillaceae bacterium]